MCGLRAVTDGGSRDRRACRLHLRLQEAAAELRWAAVAAAGSQFRSRDLFPQAAAAIALGHPEALAEAIRRSDIPKVPDQRIAYIDSYGNLKTTIPLHASRTALVPVVRVRIGHAEQEAVVSDGSFAIAPGQLALAPGSSGWPHPHGSEPRWLELFLRGGNAWEVFERPRVGARLELIARPASA
jgi:S-adenosylmethionine hydrolase